MSLISAPPQPHEIEASLDAYFEALFDAYTRAARQTPPQCHTGALAARQLTIRTVGAALHRVFTSAHRHLPPQPVYEPGGLEVLAWDEAVTGVSLPTPPWPPLPVGTTTTAPRLNLPEGGKSYRITLAEQGRIFIFYSIKRGQAVMWVQNAVELPTYVYSAPFPTLIHWWSQQQGLQLIHAGCVGTPSGAALIVGKSGSGKSTTSLHCALSGFHYLSDDLCLVRTQPQPHAYCLFSSGKLLPDSLARFPDLAAHAQDPRPGVEGKPVIFMHEHFPERVDVDLPLKVLLAPRVARTERTTFRPIPPGQALKALAPSTMLPRANPEPAAFHDMARLVRSLPCYHIELGTRMEEVSDVLRHIIAIS